MTEDYQILSKLKQRDQEGLEEAIHQYASYVMAVVSRTLGRFRTQEDAEELVSDSFVALWKGAEKLRDDSSLKYWLAVVARNAALKHLRGLELEEPLEEAVLSPEEALFVDGLERKERNRLVRGAVDSLGEEDRGIFLRHYYWEQGVAQIARETGLNESTVKSRLRRGREKLKAKLVKEECTK